MIRDKEGFLELVQQNISIIHKVCNIYCYRKAYWEDTYQEIVYNLWKSYPSFRKESQFTTWMYRVALNTALSQNRKEKKNLSIIAQGYSDAEDSMAEAAEDHNRIDLLYSAIDSLRQIDKAIVLLWLEKKSYAEISVITGLTESNVSVRLVRIKEKLKSDLKDSIEING